MLVEAYESKLVLDWDRTANLAVLLHNIHASHHNANSKRPMRGTTFAQQHPYRDIPKQYIQNVKDLKAIFSRHANG